jgi:hypothetical protein
MEKEELCALIGKGLSVRGISAVTGKSNGSVRHWLNKYGLQTTPKWGEFRESHLCSLCGKRAAGGKRYCGSCRTKIRRHRLKSAAVEFLGGKCVRCGWNKNVVGFEFHHAKEKKEYELGKMLNKSWDMVKKELVKCELLCSCCHRVEHSDRGEAFLKAVAEYKGRGFN